jgi:hypothetical protein
MDFHGVRLIRTAVAAAAVLTLGVVPSMAQSTSVGSLDGVWRLNRAASTQPGDVENHAVASDTMSDAQVAQLKEINRVMGQTSVQITIQTTPNDVTIVGGAGTDKLSTDGKKQDVQMGTAKVTSKTKWDKNQLKQEVTVADAKFTRTWQVSADGKQLVLTSKLERAADGAAAGVATRPIKFVYDKQ